MLLHMAHLYPPSLLGMTNIILHSAVNSGAMPDGLHVGHAAVHHKTC
jgi:hypothetical protein